MVKLLDWLTGLPEQATVFTVTGGNSRKMEQLYKVVLPLAIQEGWQPKQNEKSEVFQANDLDDLGDQLIEILDDTGFGVEYDKVRVFAYSSQGKQIKSKLITKPLQLDNKDLQVSAIQALASANISMTGEVRRTLATVTDSNARLLELVNQLTESFVDAKRSQVRAEQERLAYELVLDHQELEENQNVKQDGLQLLSQIAHTIFEQKQNASFDSEKLKEHIKNNPSVVDDFISDPDIVSAVMESMARGADEG